MKFLVYTKSLFKLFLQDLYLSITIVYQFSRMFRMQQPPGILNELAFKCEWKCQKQSTDSRYMHTLAEQLTCGKKNIVLATLYLVKLLSSLCRRIIAGKDDCFYVATQIQLENMQVLLTLAEYEYLFARAATIQNIVYDLLIARSIIANYFC